MDLIPGLPDEISRECLISVPYKQFSTVASVCRGWKMEIEQPEFLRRRKVVGYSQNLIVMAQLRVDPNRSMGIVKSPANPTFRLTVFEPEMGRWCEFPPIPEFSDGLPMFCGLVSVGSELVVMGGLDPVTWKMLDFVFIYNFATAKWRRGADMPGGQRLFFACASNLDRTVYVAGGHDEMKNALRSALRYDLAKDEWSRLPDMAKERDECKGIFQRGKFHVVGGYCTQRQGQFVKSEEIFDVYTWQWNLEAEFLCADVSPNTCVGNGDEGVYMCCEGEVVLKKSETWDSVAKLPADVHQTAQIVMWQKNMLVIGSSGYGRPHAAYVLSLTDYNWRKVETPDKYSGHVQSSCYLEI